MIEATLLGIALLLVIVFTIMVSNRLKVAYPILLLGIGLVLCFIPGLPQVKINPDLIFIIFLPPLLYEAAWANSWKELWKWRRMIGSFAFLVVFFTAAAVAVVANWMIPGFSLALGFLLGGIVSPPDAVSAASILKFVKIPKRYATVLEGESLLNDASSLIIFRFAAIAITTGQFIWYEAAGQFLWMVIGGGGIGLLVAYALVTIHKYLPTDTDMDIILTLVAPYLMYILAEETHASGVLSVVFGGLYISTRRHQILTASSRVQGHHVWQSFTFILNGCVFVLIGLDMPQIMEGIRSEGVDLYMATLYGIVITGVLIITRMISVYGAVVITQIMKRFITVADEKLPPPKAPLILGWAGMRGVVSLAAALSIPMMAGNEAFPHRNLILYITFIAIVLTLVVQGLTLPLLIKKTNISDPGDHLSEEETVQLIKKTIAQSSIDFVNSRCKEAFEQSYLLRHAEKMWEYQLKHQAVSLSEEGKVLYLEILEHQRNELMKLNKRADIDEEIIRKFYTRIDLEEEKWSAE